MAGIQGDVREGFRVSLLSVCRRLLPTLHFLQLQHTPPLRFSQVMSMDGLIM